MKVITINLQDLFLPDPRKLEEAIYTLDLPHDVPLKPLIKHRSGNVFWEHPWIVYVPCGKGYRCTGCCFDTLPEAYEYALRRCESSDPQAN
jgi:hypothetical protein